MVGGVGVVVSPGTGVPVGTQHHTPLGLGTEAGNDIGGMQHCTVIAFEVSLLLLDGATVGLKLTDNPRTAAVVRLRVHHPWSEIALLRRKGKGRVGIEGWADWFCHCFRHFRILIACLTILRFRTAKPATTAATRMPPEIIFIFLVISPYIILFISPYSIDNKDSFCLPLHRSHDTQPVATPYLLDVALTIPAL